jgi:NADH dehydrogenase FAD-containing subunit
LPKDVLKSLPQRTSSSSAVVQSALVTSSICHPLTIELSGEIKMANPKANVTIVHGGNLPISDAFPDNFRQKAVTTLKEHGIDIILNELVDLSTINGSKTVTLKSGKSLPADLVVLPSFDNR